MLAAAKLQFSAAMPFWLAEYYGEPVNVSWPSSSSPNQCVMNYMMPLLNDYVVMSYNTDPNNAASRVATQAKYASEMSPTTAVLAGMDVVVGDGDNVSYGDTAGKDSQAVVLSDMEVIEEDLGGYAAFSGVAINDWAGWFALPS